MKKTVITRKVAINAPKQKVWNALADFGNVQAMSPGITNSFLTSDQKNGVGAKRHCDLTAYGAELEERISEWNEGESLTIDIYESKNIPLVVDMSATFSLAENGNNTLLTASFQYGMSNSIGSVMNNLVMKKMNIKNWESFIGGIKLHVETGVHITKDTKIDISMLTQ